MQTISTMVTQGSGADAGAPPPDRPTQTKSKSPIGDAGGGVGALLRAIMEAAVDAVIVADDAGRIQVLNPAATRIFGYTTDEAVGLPVTAILPSEEGWDAAAVRRLLVGDGDDNVGTYREGVGRHKDGSTLPVGLSLSLVDEGGATRFLGIVRDMSAQRRSASELELEQKTQRLLNALLQVSLRPISLDALLNLSLDLILSTPWLPTQPRGAILLHDSEDSRLHMRAHRGLGATLIGMCARVPLGTCLCGRAAESGEVVVAQHVDDRHDHRYDGIADHGHYVVPITSGGEVLGVLALYLDVGHPAATREIGYLEAVASTLAGTIRRKQAEEELISLAARLADKNRDLESFATIVSHDLQEPLRKVIGDTERLVSALSGGGESAALALRIRATSARMRSMVDSLLTFSRLGTGGSEPTTVHPGAAVRAVLADLADRIQEAGAEVTVGSLPPVMSDPVHIRQLFQNLIANALKFHRPGVAPVITITGQLLPSGSPDVPNGPVARFTVEDNGIGLRSQDTERIFGLFSRAGGRERYEGSGVGLATCRRIVERYGGTITADGVPGSGARFKISLPAGSTTDELPVVPRLDELPTGLWILAVEDDPDDGLFLREAHARSELPGRLDLLTDGPAFLQRLRCVEEPDRWPDVVVMDMNLPGRSGRELLEDWALAPWAAVPVLVLTPSDSVEAAYRAARLPATGYLRKPVTVGALEGGVAEALSATRIVDD